MSELIYERRLAMAARRAADLFSWVSMPAAAAPLGELAEAADSCTQAASTVLTD